MDINEQTEEMRQFVALTDLAAHIAEPCSVELLRTYLDTLKGLIHKTDIKEIKSHGSYMLSHGERKYTNLVNNDPKYKL